MIPAMPTDREQRENMSIKMKLTPFILCLGLSVSGLAQKFTADLLTNPAGDGSLQANWSTTAGGDALLSWVEPSKGGSYSLRYAVRQGTTWSEVRTVVTNRRFFRHPAEVPEVLALGDHQWMAHWVEMPNQSSEAEYVYVSSSQDGLHWTLPAIAHKDRSPVEHGLVSMVGTGNGEASLFWLITPKGEDGPAYLMRTAVDASGKEVKEERLDSDVCSCCPTAVAKTPKGLLVVYRSHTPADIRDIAAIRFENGQWLPSKIIHADNWKLNACPINAAAVAARGNHAAISWFTGAQDSPKVQMIFSEDGGASFGKPTIVSTGHAFGYTSVALDDDGGAIVSWLEKASGSGSDDARILVREIAPNGAAGPVLEVAKGGRQSLGYPRICHTKGGTLIVWGTSRPAAKVQVAQLRK
jgi:hypothetical protein